MVLSDSLVQICVCKTNLGQIESLPTRTNDEQPLQNILSISTAGRNRYLLHFNSHHSLIQWTSGIRLAMYEHSTLQEAYTGALIAGKGKTLNNIGVIMERARLPVQEWVRVRFGAGVPWRRCWCVIDPPSEKDYQKAAKEQKKKSAYDRSHAPILKGEIRFYDSKKEAEKKKKHARPIASISDAYSAYAIYPQAKELIDASSLLKIEGHITIHSDPPSSTEGFVFIMPEVHPAVSGFEMLLRFLFPTWDTFGLYGRPGRLVASVLDPRSLMFAMPKHKRYGYLEILDVSGLILTDGSSGWSEQDWRKKMKELTGQRMNAVEDGSRSHSRSASRSSKRLSFGPSNNGSSRPRVGFADDSASVRSARSLSLSQPGPRTDSAPADPNREPMGGHSRHSRNISDTQLPNALSAHDLDGPGSHPSAARAPERARTFASDLASTPERVSSEDEQPMQAPGRNFEDMQRMQTPEPVNAPPAFAHGAGSRPQQQPYHSPELRKANSRLSNTTLSQLANAGGLDHDSLDNVASPHFGNGGASRKMDPRGQPVQPQANANSIGINANFSGSREVLTSPTNSNSSFPSPGISASHRGLAQNRANSPLASQPSGASGAAFRSGPSLSREPGTSPSTSHGPSSDTWSRPPGPPRDRLQGPLTSQDGSQHSRALPHGTRTPPPDRDAQFHRPGGSPPVHRKPVPNQSPGPQSRPADSVSPLSPQSPAQTRTLAQSTIAAQAAAADRYLRRQDSERSAMSSQFGDASSTASPDYASTRKSTDTQESVERPRAGVLKTIGSDNGGSQTANSGDPRSEYNIPDINFGPTINYGASANKSQGPNNSVAITHKSDSGYSTPHQRPFSPTTGRKSPGPGFGYSHFRQESDDTIRRTVPWQPGTAAGTAPAQNTLSPEQFVQNRIAITTVPIHSHQRSLSSNTVNEFRAGTPTSPYKRPGSHGHSRHNSAELLQSGRPISQGTPVALSGGEVSSYLSAREQEHIARVTGSPLIAFAANKPAAQPKGGLVGAIQTRERERAQMMQGIGGHAVAQAIDQRQREQNLQAHRAAQAAYAQQQAQYVSQHGYASPQGAGGMGAAPFAQGSGFQGVHGYGPQSPRHPMIASQVAYNNSPNPQAYGQGGNWGNPGMQNQRPPLQATSSHGFGTPAPGFPQTQYHASGNMGRPGTPGRMQHQGQAF